MSTERRAYRSPSRAAAADRTRARILAAARALFAERGIEATTLAAIAAAAGVSEATVYKAMGSKVGLLRELMRAALFGPATRAALDLVAGETDPVRAIARTAAVARAVYEAEAREVGDVRAIAARSPLLREIEAEFEALRLEMQAARVDALFAAGLARGDLSRAEAGRVLWLYTSREVWWKLTAEAGWTGDQYQAWLARTLVEALVARRD
jgi:AcrR family transcriptional regulator